MRGLRLSSSVTVGICAYNEGMNIDRLLSNVLFEQELPAGSEVLVVCSGCTDNTVEIVQKFSEKDPRVKAYVEKERQGKASAINHILANAKGDLIIFVSADTLPSKDCFSKLTSELQTPKTGIASGNPVPINDPKHLTGRVVQVLWRFHGHVFEQLNDAGLARHATEVFCVRKNIVKSIPANTVNDDAYIAVSAKKMGWLIKYVSDARVSISGPQTIPDYFRQRRRILSGHYQIKKSTGESPQHLIYLLQVYPIKAVKLSGWLFTKYDISTVSAFLLIEFLANLISIGDAISRKSHFKWSIARTTKVQITSEVFR